MRPIGTLDDRREAELLGDYLLTLGVRNEVREGRQGWIVWVLHDDDMERGIAEFEAFQNNPEHERYRNVKREAAGIRRDAERTNKKRMSNIISLRQGWFAQTTAASRGLANRARKTGKVAGVMILLSVLVALFTQLGEDHNAFLDALFLAPVADLLLGGSSTGLSRVMHGEVWRLFTPMFIHFGLLHIAFNMYWLHYLGSHIEEHKGALKMIGIVLATAVGSNLAQYWWTGPYSGGMSGVNYGLFGYVWMKALFAPGEDLAIQKTTVYVLVAWLFICMTGWVGPIGNAAHVAGLVIGMLLGGWPVLLRKLRQKNI